MRNHTAKGQVLWAWIAVAILITSGQVYAQVGDTSTVLGVVADSTGAVTAGATVTLHNLDSGTFYKAQSNDSGEYRFFNVAVGRYELTAEETGFKKTVHSAFDVHAAEPARIDIVLTIGAVTEEVKVTADDVPVVNTVSANEGNTVTGEQVNNLPLTNRVFTQLVTLEPGVSAPVVVDPGFGSNSSLNFSVNGVRDDKNNLLVDGIRNADTFGGNAFVTPNLFARQLQHSRRIRPCRLRQDAFAYA